ncbi:M15 family metallopeptidase [Mucilaginibacter kameinonensis]|uniref:M15 family metallopeptidase n=1 Tax=Mucilaginibacter kameinonensis TaxID=452286 RepID=UPI0013CE4E74|nr:M15 family metallopeptidase [Mucilaginibacter kameinonensis]
MTEIWEYAVVQLNSPTDDDVRCWLHQNRLDQTGGGFNFRKSTGNTSALSLHSYGIAIDWDPVHNPHKKPLTKPLPDWWYNIWTKHGWSDGRHFKTPDPMHVQFATGA